jgi:hypothetical protein
MSASLTEHPLWGKTHLAAKVFVPNLTLGNLKRVTVRLKLAFCMTCAVRVLVLAQGPSFLRLRRALLRQKGIHKMRGVRQLLREEWRQSRGAVPLLPRKLK